MTEPKPNPFIHSDIRPGPCHGSVHVIPVPRWMSDAEAWNTICEHGRLPVEDPECSWATVTCPGDDDCICGGIQLSETFTWHHDDVLIYHHASTLAAEDPEAQR